MTSAVLVPCLVQLRAELDRIAPGRDRSSDGWIGDPAHQSRTSDHNDDEAGQVPIRDADSKHEVHAVDLDADLHESDLTMEKVVQHVLSRCRKDADDPDNEPRLRYIIFNRRIWEAPGWKQQTYTGDNPHDKHAHFSAEYVTELEASTASWRLEDIPVALTDADKKWLEQTIDKRVGDVVVRRYSDGEKVGGDNPTMTVASAAEYGTWYADEARTRIAAEVLPALARIENRLADQSDPTA